MTAGRVTVMAGGTGGHVFPALATAQELARRGWEVSWLGVPDSFESRLVPAYGFPLDLVPVRKMRGQGLGAWLLAPLHLATALVHAGRAPAVAGRASCSAWGASCRGPAGWCRACSATRW